MIDSIRLSNTEKELLVRVKRKTGIDSWNIICRWALLMGLAQKELSTRVSAEKRDAIEIRWETFSGKNKAIFEAVTLIKYKELSNKNISLFDFIHNQLEVGIRILHRETNKSLLSHFSDAVKQD